MSKLLPVAALAVSACTIFDDVTYRPQVGPPLPDAAPVNACGKLVEAGCSDSDPGTTVSFQRDVLQGIFQPKCMQHMMMQMMGFNLTTYATLMKGNELIPRLAVVPCEPCNSVLAQKLVDPPPFGMLMPMTGVSLTDQEIAVIRDWIAEGAQNN